MNNCQHCDHPEVPQVARFCPACGKQEWRAVAVPFYVSFARYVAARLSVPPSTEKVLAQTVQRFEVARNALADIRQHQARLECQNRRADNQMAETKLMMEGAFKIAQGVLNACGNDLKVASEDTKYLSAMSAVKDFKVRLAQLEADSEKTKLLIETLRLDYERGVALCKELGRSVADLKEAIAGTKMSQAMANMGLA